MSHTPIHHGGPAAAILVIVGFALVAVLVGLIVLLMRGRLVAAAILFLGGVAGVFAALAAVYLTQRPTEPTWEAISYNEKAHVASSGSQSQAIGEDSVDAITIEVDSAGERTALEGVDADESAETDVAAVEPTPAPELTPGEVIIPQGRPDWVEAQPQAENGAYYIAVNSGPYDSSLSSREALDEVLTNATHEYIDEVLEQRNAWRFFDYSPRYIRTHLVDQEYSEVIQVSFGPMHQRHALLRFDASFIEGLKMRWRDLVVGFRLAGIGLLFVAVTSVLAVAYGFLRLDSATRGYYSGRLQFGAGVTILAIIGAGVLVARWLPWG